MFKRNRKLRQNKKYRNKLHSLLCFQLMGCVGVPFNEEGVKKVRYHAMLAIQYFLKKNYSVKCRIKLKEKQND